MLPTRFFCFDADVFLHRAIRAFVTIVFVFGLTQVGWSADVCPRFPVGSTVQDPPALYSSGGILEFDMTYQTEVDENGLTRFCFVTSDGKEAPTLYLNPGDELVMRVKNLVPEDAAGLPVMKMPPMTGMEIDPAAKGQLQGCGGVVPNSASVNVHYHGTNLSPVCHSDEVIQTVINSGDSFTYRAHFPKDEPPGIYWYHPHIHGLAEAALQGGASGLIVVGGIENIQPIVAGLKQRILVVRDNLVPGGGSTPPEPAWDVSLNYIPIPYPNYPPAVINIGAGEKQFWRVANTAADTILDLQLVYDGEPQLLTIVGIDGVPTGSQDGTRTGKTLSVRHFRLAPAGRVEFVLTGPSAQVQNAQLLTKRIPTGPDGDYDPARPLAILSTTGGSSETLRQMPQAAHVPGRQRFEGLLQTKPVTKRTLYFSENNPLSQFFITVQGQKPKLFDPQDPPAIVTTEGSVEDWKIENRTLENHEFHIHQLHFLLLDRNGKPVNKSAQQFMDTIDIPFWKGSGPYPSVTVRMDFRGAIAGTFVYHCHILEHEDGGMMQEIQVLPRKAQSTTNLGQGKTIRSVSTASPSKAQPASQTKQSKTPKLVPTQGKAISPVKQE